jgi:hypothetical protein
MNGWKEGVGGGWAWFKQRDLRRMQKMKCEGICDIMVVWWCKGISVRDKHKGLGCRLAVREVIVIPPLLSRMSAMRSVCDKFAIQYAAIALRSHCVGSTFDCAYLAIDSRSNHDAFVLRLCCVCAAKLMRLCCFCTGFVLRLHSVCTAYARYLHCICTAFVVFAQRLHCVRAAFALRLHCVCTAFAMRLQCVCTAFARLHCVSHAIKRHSCCICNALFLHSRLRYIWGAFAKHLRYDRDAFVLHLRCVCMLSRWFSLQSVFECVRNPFMLRSRGERDSLCVCSEISSRCAYDAIALRLRLCCALYVDLLVRWFVCSRLISLFISSSIISLNPLACHTLHVAAFTQTRRRRK